MNTIPSNKGQDAELMFGNGNTGVDLSTSTGSFTLQMGSPSESVKTLQAKYMKRLNNTNNHTVRIGSLYFDDNAILVSQAAKTKALANKSAISVKHPNGHYRCAKVVPENFELPIDTASIVQVLSELPVDGGMYLGKNVQELTALASAPLSNKPSTFDAIFVVVRTTSAQNATMTVSGGGNTSDTMNCDNGVYMVEGLDDVTAATNLTVSGSISGTASATIVYGVRQGVR